MPNGTGLFGTASSTQGALIIPEPNNTNIYFIFTVPCCGSTTLPLCYSVVDMTLDEGLGDINS
jgi:hypothetical protein